MSSQEIVKQSLTDFVTQALTGVHMACHRMGIPFHSENPETSQLKLAFGHKYLNSIFSSLIRRDDTYLNQTFDRIYGHPSYFSDSPICLIHLISQIFQVAHTLPEHLKPMGDLDSVRETVQGFFYPRIKELVNKYLEERVAHQCTNVKYGDLGREDPKAPIFRINVNGQPL